jgi:propanol-preferring alcohol dehydrogenase
LGLYGFGAAAHICIQIARHWGWDVFVFTRSQAHRELATELGAAWVGGAEDNPPARLDSGVIFAPAGWIVPEALRALNKGGTLALGGIHMSPIPEMPYALLYHERVVRSVANSTRQDAEGLLQVAAEIPIHTTIQTFPLDAANHALQMLKRSEIDGAGVLEISR